MPTLKKPQANKLIDFELLQAAVFVNSRQNKEVKIKGNHEQRFCYSENK